MATASEAWFKIINPESKWDLVILEGIKYVAQLKKAIKKQQGAELSAYPTNRLTIKAKKEKTDDDNEARELDETEELASALKEHGTWLLVYVPSVTLPSKRSLNEQNSKRFRKEFKPNSTVFKGLREYVYYADQRRNNATLIDTILQGSFVRMYGPRASGKSSRVVDAMIELESKGYECIYVDFQKYKVSSEESFWKCFNGSFRRYRLPLAISNSDDFIHAFELPNKRWSCPVVLFFDEFDVLHGNNAKDARSSMLSTIREIRNDPAKGTRQAKTVIQSIVSIGTFAILSLNQDSVTASPFNAVENFRNASLTKEQVQELFQEFASDRDITIDPEVVDDIFLQTNGHAGLVNVCGKAIDTHLLPLIDERLHLDHWQHFSLTSLRRNTMAYGTFQKMVDSLTGDSEQHRAAIDFLRSFFLGNFDEFVPVPRNDKHLAEYLAAQGVLYPDQIEDVTKFKMSSPLVDSIIRQGVIPILYPSCPNTASPKKDGKAGADLDVLETLKESLKFFDKELIQWAPSRSYKKSTVRVDGCIGQKIPRESIYDSELMRILTNWLANQERYEITGQWHLQELDSARYSDIVIKKSGDPMVVLELLATGDKSFIKSHIDKTSVYKHLLSAQEAWVVHFTREDNYLQSENVYWQSDELLNKGIYMVHFWHNRDFTEVWMSARWKDGTLKRVDNERVI